MKATQVGEVPESRLIAITAACLTVAPQWRCVIIGAKVPK